MLRHLLQDGGQEFASAAEQQGLAAVEHATVGGGGGGRFDFAGEGQRLFDDEALEVGIDGNGSHGGLRPTGENTLIAYLAQKCQRTLAHPWGGYNRLPDENRGHATVNHTPGQREWARDDDGDGIREVHDNTLEGLWAALRTFLRPFRGISKHYLNQYVAVFQWVYNLKVGVPESLRRLLGLNTSSAP